jgi:CCR4-NOT transcription complex subunit 3
MSLVRKLQVEVERTLKRIDEGLKDFDDLYDKVAGVDGAAQKQRLEGDLKTEIKKLQKLRDQVKTWAAGPEIKNKQQLTEAREKIERRMEAFKVVERETKTKAYSKEGLARTQALSEEERRKLKAREWVQDAVSKLGDQLDELEAELEVLAEAGGGGGGGARGKKDKETAARLESVVASHRLHVDKLEALTRLLDRGDVKPEEVRVWPAASVGAGRVEPARFESSQTSPRSIGGGRERAPRHPPATNSCPTPNYTHTHTLTRAPALPLQTHATIHRSTRCRRT